MISNEARHVEINKKLNDPLREIKVILTKRLIKDLINGYSIREESFDVSTSLKVF